MQALDGDVDPVVQVLRCVLDEDVEYGDEVVLELRGVRKLVASLDRGGVDVDLVDHDIELQRVPPGRHDLRLRLYDAGDGGGHGLGHFLGLLLQLLLDLNIEHHHILLFLPELLHLLAVLGLEGLELDEQVRSLGQVEDRDHGGDELARVLAARVRGFLVVFDNLGEQLLEPVLNELDAHIVNLLQGVQVL